VKRRSWALRLIGLLLPSWKLALLGIGLSVFALAANMALLALSSWFITAMAVAGAVGGTLDYDTPSAAVRALALARAGGRYAERLVNHDTTLRLLSTIRVWFFRRLEPLAPARLQEHRSGDLLARVRADVDTLDDFYVRGVVPTVAAALALIVLLPVLASFDPRLAAVDLAGLAVGGVLVPLILQAAARRPGRERVVLSSELRATVVEHAQGMAELIALGAVRERAELANGLIHRLDRTEGRLSLLQGAGDGALIAASSLAAWGAALLLASRVSEGLLSGPLMAMLVMLVLASFEMVMPLPVVLQRAGELAAAARRLFQLIDAAPAVPSPPGPPVPVPAGFLDLSIRSLRFRYAPDAPWVLDGFSLEVPAGGRVGLSGPSGIGKSTLVSLLLRFWDYEGGSIRAGGVELKSLRSEEAIRLFSVLPQSPYFFHASIRENLALALPDGREGDEAAIRAALETVQLSPLLDTTVGEHGHEISAGEARRLAAARALLKDAPIFILDEPTEGLDDETAGSLLAALDSRLRGKTLLLISHRERDFRIVDQVVRLRAQR
jgi:ATP-binding cassette, subfamily C, bacterial CydC